MNAVYNALGLFASALKSGEPWTNDCQLALDEAKTALRDAAERDAAWRDLVQRAWQTLDTECPELEITAELLAALRNTS